MQVEKNIKSNYLKESICIALDVDHSETALSLVDQLKDYVGFFKIGMQLFYNYGPDLVQKLVAKGVKVFLDLKFHDIPNTVKQASIAATRMNVHMFNVHTAGGLTMMQQAVEGAKNISEKENIPMPTLLGVTILTSLTQYMLTRQLNWPGTIDDKVTRLASLSKEAGLQGVVSSPHEIELIRKSCGQDFTIVTPGVRPQWSVLDDQKRVMLPMQAIEKGASMIVVGRPVIRADEPVKAVQQLFCAG